MKFITTIVALSFAVLTLAAVLPVDPPIQPQGNLKRAGTFYVNQCPSSAGLTGLAQILLVAALKTVFTPLVIP
ncbi:hypothetical protein BJV78DRAFT_1253204 [Lactifluus subvellereus]|nr:hypothetical protein BJV78DRAFT_1253204 [Lactifluus subvellereus]